MVSSSATWLVRLLHGSLTDFYFYFQKLPLVNGFCPVQPYVYTFPARKLKVDIDDIDEHR